MILGDGSSRVVGSADFESSPTVVRSLDDAARERWSMSPAMQARCAQFQATVVGVRQKAIAMREAALESRLDVWRLRLGQPSTFTDLGAALEIALDGALSLNSADFANIQLYDSTRRALVLTAHRGFHQPFLEFFAFVKSDTTSCGIALREQRSVVVQDVVYSPIFIGSHALAVLLEADVRAIMSTPLIGQEGTRLGVMSVYYRRPRAPIDSDLVRFEALARVVARLIEGIGQPSRKAKT